MYVNNTSTWTFRLRFLLGDKQICEIWTPKITFVNVLLTHNVMTFKPFRAIRVGAKVQNNLHITKEFEWFLHFFCPGTPKECRFLGCFF